MTGVRAALTGPTRALFCLLIAALGAAIISGILAMHVMTSPRGHDMTAEPASTGPAAMPMSPAALPIRGLDFRVSEIRMSDDGMLEGDTSGAQRSPGHDAMAMACALALLAVGILLLAAAARRSTWLELRVALSAMPRLLAGSRDPPDLNVLCVCRT
ncbi:MAG: hypothetical protein HY996_00965 [Micrococcales bacterium]|nr:hypothetical protein [Micrococcales bacterium]